MLDDLVVNRAVLQTMTLVISFVAFLLLFSLVCRRQLAWKYSLLPGSVLLQLIAFYFFVVFTAPSPSPVVTFWSSVIRFETVLSVFVTLIIFAKVYDHD